MSYQALYRKLRPQTFKDVIGQPHIVTTLTNQLLSGRISHAYLFCGTRGTGKTSTAKIFARALNCPHVTLEGEPCNSCEMCESILLSRCTGVVEIDAASNNGVDNIREIREEVRYAPTEGKYRIYIIDEVHMLSGGAFNALLKTLEEPPPYVVFILATTEPQKIPPTVLSRVQRFDFRRISATDMVEVMEAYMTKEGVTVDKEALQYVANLSDGAMRDALSLLDQSMAFYHKEPITLEKVLDMVGAVDDQSLFDMVDALSAFDSTACMLHINEVMLKGRDMHQFVSDLVAHLRNLLMTLHVKLSSTALAFSQETINQLTVQANRVGQDWLLWAIEAFAQLQADMKYTSNGRLMLEVLCIKLCNPAEAGDNSREGLLARIQKLETDMAKGVPITQAQATVSQAPPTLPPKTAASLPQVEEADVAIPEANLSSPGTADLLARWPKMCQSFPVLLKGILKAADVAVKGHVLSIAVADKAQAKLVEERADIIKEKIQAATQADFQLSVSVKGQSNSPQATENTPMEGQTMYTELLGDHIIFEE